MMLDTGLLPRGRASARLRR